MVNSESLRSPASFTGRSASSGIFFQDLSLADKRRRFNNLIFPCIEMDYTDDEKVLKELYRRLNFSGTPHTEADLELLNA